MRVRVTWFVSLNVCLGIGLVPNGCAQSYNVCSFSTADAELSARTVELATELATERVTRLVLERVSVRMESDLAVQAEALLKEYVMRNDTSLAIPNSVVLQLA